MRDFFEAAITIDAAKRDRRRARVRVPPAHSRSARRRAKLGAWS